MFAGSITRLSRSRTDSHARPFAPDVAITPARARGGVVWITGVAGTARAGLVTAVQHQLERWWHVDLIAPEDIDGWLERADELSSAVVVSTSDRRTTRANARPRIEAADRAFVEILAVSDWDALVERTDATLFEHVAGFLTGRRHEPRPHMVVRLDWLGPAQIEKRVAAALERAGLVPEQPSSVDDLHPVARRQP